VDTISFLSSMVTAIADGKKTVTRRPLKTQPPDSYYYHGVTGEEVWFYSSPRGQSNVGDYFTLKSSYGKVGNSLLVNEPWLPYKTTDGAGIYYEDGTLLLHSEALKLCNGNGVGFLPAKWRSPSSLPNWASRFKIEITSIEVERLHTITDDDIRKEGIYLDYLCPQTEILTQKLSRKDLFVQFWDLCYQKSFPWESDPYVWVLNFELK